MTSASDSGATAAGMRVAVVVPTWNGESRLRSCLTSLARQTYEPTIVVVDNASTDDTAATLDALTREVAPVEVVTLNNERNLGFAGGVNTGIRWALARDFDAVALLNNDAIAEPTWLAELVAAMVAHPDAGLVTSRLLLGDGQRVDSTGDFYSVWALPFPRDRERSATPVRPSGYVFGGSGGATLYRRSVFTDVGLFDEHFFAYYEDVDLSFRAQLRGVRTWYCATAVAHHAQGSTAVTMPGFATGQMMQNMPLLLVKNVPSAWLPAIVGRFVLLYPLLLANAVRRGEGAMAIRGVGRGVRRLPAALRARRAIQQGAVDAGVDLDALRAQVWPALPPGLVIARRLRNRVRRLLRLPELRDGLYDADPTLDGAPDT